LWISAARVRRHGAVRGGLQDGLIDIALDDGQLWFEELHDYPDEARFLSALNRQLRNHCGFMADIILHTIGMWRNSATDLAPRLQMHRDEYLKIAQKSFAGNGGHDTHHEAFATIFAAGATFLVDCELVRWTLSDLTESLLVCEAAAIKTATEGW
jgi:hypothetical protein